MVLASRCGWAESPGSTGWPSDWCLLVSTDGESESSSGCRVTHVVAELCRLSVSGVQYQHRIIADGCAGALALGQAADDAAGPDLFNGHRVAGGARCQYALKEAEFFPGKLRLFCCQVGPNISFQWRPRGQSF